MIFDPHVVCQVCTSSKHYFFQNEVFCFLFLIILLKLLRWRKNGKLHTYTKGEKSD